MSSPSLVRSLWVASLALAAARSGAGTSGGRLAHMSIVKRKESVPC